MALHHCSSSHPLSVLQVAVRYEPYVCNADNPVYVANNTEQTRKSCMAVGKPLLDTDFEVIAAQASAVSVRDPLCGMCIGVSVRGATRAWPCSMCLG